MPSAESIVVQGVLDQADDLVVFFPPAGSVTSPYFPLGARLPSWLPSVHCEIPGRGRLATEPAPTSVSGAVQRWLPEIVLAATGRRAHLFGHSLGATFAYELARHAPVAVASVLLSGARVPGSASRGTVAAAVAALSRFRADSAESADPVDQWWAADAQLRQDYVGGDEPVRFPLAVFAGKQDVLVRPDEMDAWTRWVSGPFLGKFTFAGGHDYYLSDPDSVAAAIAEAVPRGRVEDLARTEPNSEVE